jgi:ubiquinone/menaquinone biosynthesis C-methylase UbiE
MVDNPFSAGRTNATMAQLELSPGLQVLDAGCGPGRMTIPMARAVGPEGKVMAVDIQPEMLRRAQHKASHASLFNIQFLHAALGQGSLPSSTFDRAVLVTVLGEIPDQVGALREIYASLKPGGFLLVNEVMGDPHYQTIRKVRALAEAVDFRPGPCEGNALAYSLRLEKSLRA